MKKVTMTFEPSTLEVLKHFATINSTLVFRKGSTLKTMSTTKNLAASAALKQEIPRDFAIADLERFIGALSLFEDPQVTLDSTFCTIKDKRTTVRYGYADDSIIRQKYPDKSIKLLNEPIFSFELSAGDYTALKNGMSALGLVEAAIVGDGKKLSLKGSDMGNKRLDVFSLAIGEASKQFRAVLKAYNMKILAKDYQVVISKGIASWKSVDGSIEYWTSLLEPPVADIRAAAA